MLICQKTADAKLLLLMRGKHRIDNLTMSEIADEEVPDASAFLKAFNKIQPKDRTGTIEIDDIPCPRPGKKVEITFQGLDGKPTE
jgi:hypothetical protein